MKRMAMIVAAAALSIVGPAQAANDAGLTLHDGPMVGRSSASGAGLSLKARWDAVDRRNTSPLSAVELRAGPVLTLRDGSAIDGFRRGIVPVAALRFGRSDGIAFHLVGQELASDARSHANEDKPKKKQSTGDKIAWVAAVAGGVMLALVGGVLIHCSGGNCSE